MKRGSYYFPPTPSSMLITLMLHTQTGKNCCARVIVSPLAGRACSEQDLMYSQVLFILSQPARAHIWRTLTRFSHAVQAPALRVGMGMQH
jgi:hypothetical protein